MRSLFLPRTTITLFALAYLSCAHVAHAQVAINFPVSDFTVNASSSPTTVTLSGTITVAPGYFLQATFVNGLSNSANTTTPIPVTFDSTFLAYSVMNPKIPGLGYTGPIAYLTVAPSTVPGLYTTSSGFGVTVTNAAGQQGSARQFYTINVLAAVPEPGSVALLFGLATTGAGFLARRRRHKVVSPSSLS